MKVRVGNVVFEDFDANELDTVIMKLRQVGLLGSSEGEEEPAPRPIPVQRPAPLVRQVPVQMPAPAPMPRPIPVSRPQMTLPQAPVPPQPIKPSEPEEEEPKSSGWL